MNKLVKLTGLTLGLVLGLTSCTKEEGIESSLSSSTTVVNHFEEINNFDLTQRQPSASSRALPTVTVTINGQENELDLSQDFFYDDGADNLIHLSQSYTIDLVAETVITTTVDESTGNIVETESDVTNTFEVYFNGLVDTDTNALSTLGESSIIVTNLNQDYSFTIGVENASTTVALPMISYNDGSTTFNIEL